MELDYCDKRTQHTNRIYKSAMLLNNQLPEIHCTLKYIMYDTLKCTIQTLHPFLFELFFCKKIPLSRRVGYVMDGSMGQ